MSVQKKKILDEVRGGEIQIVFSARWEKKEEGKADGGENNNKRERSPV